MTQRIELPATPRERQLIADAIHAVEKATREAQIAVTMFIARHGRDEATVVGVNDTGIICDVPDGG